MSQRLKRGRMPRERYRLAGPAAIKEILALPDSPPPADRRAKWSFGALVAVLVLASLDFSRAIVPSTVRAARRIGLDASYQGFMAAALRAGLACARGCRAEVERRCLESSTRAARIRGFVPLAVDGTRISLPRTRANLRAHGGVSRESGEPQALLVALVHATLRVPFRWRLGSARLGERALLEQMLDGLPPNALLLMDAGFGGHGFLSELHRRGIRFVVRGSRLTPVARAKGRTYLWPRGLSPSLRPLEVRLVRRGRVAMLTNVLDPRELTDRDVKRAYRRRWSAEVCWRELKRTLRAARMRTRLPQHAEVEAEGAMLAHAAVALLGAREREARRALRGARARGAARRGAGPRGAARRVRAAARPEEEARLAARRVVAEEEGARGAGPRQRPPRDRTRDGEAHACTRRGCLTALGGTTSSSGFAHVTETASGPGPSDSPLLEVVPPILAVDSGDWRSRFALESAHARSSRGYPSANLR